MKVWNVLLKRGDKEFKHIEEVACSSVQAMEKADIRFPSWYGVKATARFTCDRPGYQDERFGKDYEIQGKEW